MVVVTACRVFRRCYRFRHPVCQRFTGDKDQTRSRLHRRRAQSIRSSRVISPFLSHRSHTSFREDCVIMNNHCPEPCVERHATHMRTTVIFRMRKSHSFRLRFNANPCGVHDMNISANVLCITVYGISFAGFREKRGRISSTYTVQTRGFLVVVWRGGGGGRVCTHSRVLE